MLFLAPKEGSQGFKGISRLAFGETHLDLVSLAGLNLINPAPLRPAPEATVSLNGAERSRRMDSKVIKGSRDMLSGLLMCH